MPASIVRHAARCIALSDEFQFSLCWILPGAAFKSPLIDLKCSEFHRRLQRREATKCHGVRLPRYSERMLR